MAQGRLPASPDFTSASANDPGATARRRDIYGLLGKLGSDWSNNESLLIYAIMLLLRTDATSAALVFATLNTTRARVDLIQRLARANLRDPIATADLKGLLKRFDSSTKMRNDINHSMFAYDANGDIVETHAMRIEERNGNMRFGASRPMDGRRIEQISKAVEAMSVLNRDFWSFLPRLQVAMTANGERPSIRRAEPSADAGEAHQIDTAR